MSTGRALVVLVGNSAAYCHMGYSHCLLGAKPLGASKVLRFPGPKSMRIVVVRGQTSSRTPFILSEVMTDVARGKVPLRFESAASLCDFKQPRSGPVFISLKLPPSPKRTGSAEDNGICDGRVEARQGVPRGGGGAGISSGISESARPGDGDTTAAARGARPDAPPDRWNARRLAHFVTAARRGRGRGGRGAPPAGAARRRDPVRVERDPVRHFFPARGAVDVDIGSSTSDAGARIAGRSCDSPPTARRGRARRAVASALNRPPSASRPVKRDRAASGFPRDDVDLARALETAPVVAGPPRRRPRGSRGPGQPLFRHPDARGGAGAGFRSISTETTTLARAPRGAGDELA